MSAYQREFEEDHSWEQLKEDEFGRLVALVPTQLAYSLSIELAVGWMTIFM